MILQLRGEIIRTSSTHFYEWQERKESLLFGEEPFQQWEEPWWWMLHNSRLIHKQRNHFSIRVQTFFLNYSKLAINFHRIIWNKIEIIFSWKFNNFHLICRLLRGKYNSTLCSFHDFWIGNNCSVDACWYR